MIWKDFIECSIPRRVRCVMMDEKKKGSAENKRIGQGEARGRLR